MIEYSYTNHRKKIFTDEGQREFLKVRDRVEQLLEEAGAFMMFSALKGRCGNCWDMMAYIDRLVELDEIREISQVGRVAGQHRIFVSTDKENGCVW